MNLRNSCWVQGFFMHQYQHGKGTVNS
ncbi:hypothetical protein KGM_215367 [Danaus plexippus plexippus]|uniref:Uncharacterized protein n=1 Tax=Danaus plexippus plexippus TaxID=278856 RepID=A0A212EHY8_DANPL|nr:hypothetical protein KGM_215367 [Danaus plexippus plexippus]